MGTTIPLLNSDAYNDNQMALREVLERRHQKEITRRSEELWERKKFNIPYKEYWEYMRLVAEYEHWEREKLMQQFERHWKRTSLRLWQCAKPEVIYL